MLNVGELLLSRKHGGGTVSYGILSVAYGLGFIAGSLPAKSTVPA